MSPDVYPSKEHFDSVVSKLDAYDQITIVDYLRGEVGQARGMRLYYFLAGMVVMGLIALVMR